MRTSITFFLLLGSVLCGGIPSGFIVNTATKAAYKLMYQSATWPVARDTCKELGAHLAVPRTQDEFVAIQKLVRGMQYPSISDTDNKLVVWLGINNLQDYRVWRNVYDIPESFHVVEVVYHEEGLLRGMFALLHSLLGEDIRETGFSTWSGDNGKGFSNAPEEPHCGAIDAANPGLRDYWCHRRQPYICQINLNNEY